MDFCTFCLELIQKSLEKVPEDWRFDVHELDKETSFRQTATTCQLCHVILHGLQDPHFQDVPLHLTILSWKEYIKSEQGLICEWRITFTGVGGRKKSEILKFVLWADEGGDLGNSACSVSTNQGKQVVPPLRQ